MSKHPVPDRQRCHEVITFHSVLSALVFVIALNLSYLVLQGPARNTIPAYGHLWNALFLVFLLWLTSSPGVLRCARWVAEAATLGRLYARKIRVFANRGDGADLASTRANPQSRLFVLDA